MSKCIFFKLKKLKNFLTAKVVAFGLLIAHRQLVALVRFKRLNLDAPDFNTIVVCNFFRN